MKPERFRLVTSYEAFHFAKPDPRYYQEIMEMLGAQPGQCLMVGNDTLEDMDGASRAGLEVFLLTDYLRDPGHTAHRYRRGSKMELLRFLDEYLNEVNG
jgi:FMN phosphatase YigB (HAD superfamily)